MIKNNDHTGSSIGRKITLLLVLLAIVLAIFIAWKTTTSPRTDDAYAYADTIGVVPQVSGNIIEMAVKENQVVKKGDLLFRIDPREYEATLTKAEANLIVLDDQIRLLQRTVNSQKLGAAAMGAGVLQARAQAKQANDTLGRMNQLLAKKFISEEGIDQARTSRISAEAQLKAAIFNAKQATAGVTSVDALVAQRAVLNAEIELAKLNVEYTTIRAPFDGIVLNKNTLVGQFALAGKPIFTLIDTSHWYVIANFRENQLEHITPGQSAQVYVLSNPSKRFAGIVQSIGYGVSPEDSGDATNGLPNVPRNLNWIRVAQRFPVRILVQQADPSIFRIGASAVAILSTSSSAATAIVASHP
jgi:membrane fusion protein, multidrug efflux system